MDRQQAKNLIDKTFKNRFDKKNYIIFAQELLDGITVDGTTQFTYAGIYIPDTFKEHIISYGRIGKYTDSKENEIDVLWVNLKRSTALDRARTMQRNFAAWYLNKKNRKNALVAFYNEELPDWRFSFVKLDIDLVENDKGNFKAKNHFTAARRYSFLVGEQEPNHTAQSRLMEILATPRPSLTDVEEAFNIEKVSLEFFSEYKELYLKLVESLEGLRKNDKFIEFNFTTCNVENSDFCKKLLGQLVFLYFIQKKGWLGVKRDGKWGDGDKRFLRNIFEKAKSEGKNFFNDYLEPLFYEALALDRDKDYYKLLDCKIPFLNGGLFEPINGYDWGKTDIEFDNALFSNDEVVSKTEDKGTGILDVFDRFNFTVKEDEPLEKEVAIDPEMLGKVFEELLDIKDRKSKGAFYTPREIVHYMCQESLINYLCTKLSVAESSFDIGKEQSEFDIPEDIEKQPELGKNLLTKIDIETLVRHVDKVAQNEFVSKVKEKEKEKNIIKDSKYEYKLSSAVRVNANEIDKALENIKICDPAIGSGAFPVGMMNEIVRIRIALVEAGYIKQTKKRTPYDYKKQAILNSIYGVDIDAGAIEIAKLRLWLSLVVDEDDADEIQPLPNLDYKIVCGNSLLRVDRNVFNNMFYSKMEELKPIYFEETRKREKQKLKAEIDSYIELLTDNKKSFDFEIYFSEVFHHNKGFDVIIGNPPYISHDKIDKNDKKFLKNNYDSFEPFADIYCYFIERGIELQSNNGLIAFITSNSYLKADYGKSLRSFIVENNKVKCLINIEDYQVFQSAIVNTSIIISEKSLKDNPIFIVNDKFTSVSNFNSFINTVGYYYPQKELTVKPWTLEKTLFLKLRKKIEKKGTSLESLKTKIRLGIATGDNKVFVIDNDTKNLLASKDEKNLQIIKPIIRGRDIQRYYYNNSDLNIILTKNGIDVQREYPSIYEYLDSFGENFKSRGAKGQHWTNLRACSFFDDFKKEKIIWIELTDKGRFAICSDEIYLINSAYFLLPPDELDSKYLLAILNSNLIQFYLSLIAETSGMGTTRWINIYVKDFPIVIASIDIQRSISKISTQIISTLTGDKNSDITALEFKIDLMVYKLYDLTYSEVLILDPEFSLSEQEYNSYDMERDSSEIGSIEFKDSFPSVDEDYKLAALLMDAIINNGRSQVVSRRDMVSLTSIILSLSDIGIFLSDASRRKFDSMKKQKALPIFNDKYDPSLPSIMRYMQKENIFSLSKEETETFVGEGDNLLKARANFPRNLPDILPFAFEILERYKQYKSGKITVGISEKAIYEKLKVYEEKIEQMLAA